MKDENFNDNQMQDENNRHEIIQKIRESADKEKIPESLNPENLDRLLEQGKNSKGRNGKWRDAAADFAFRYRKTAGVAAACMILVVAAVNLMPLMNLNYRSENKADSAQSMDTSSEAAKQDTGAEDSAASGGDMGAEPKDSKDMAKADEAAPEKKSEDKETAEGYIAGSSYEELYEQIYTETENARKEWEQKRMADTGGYVEESGGSSASKNDAAASTEAAVAEDTAGTAAGYAAGGETDFSSTNVRTEGVDEGDIVKTDGSYIYTLTGSGTLRIVSADGGSMSVAGQTSLDDLTDSIQEMYVDGNTLCVVTSGYDSGLEWQGDETYMVNSRDFIRLYTYDITDKSKITLKGMVEQEGGYYSTRKVGIMCISSPSSILCTERTRRKRSPGSMCLP